MKVFYVPGFTQVCLQGKKVEKQATLNTYACEGSQQWVIVNDRIVSRTFGLCLRMERSYSLMVMLKCRGDRVQRFALFEGRALQCLESDGIELGFRADIGCLCIRR